MTLLLFCVLSGSALWDLRTGRIPNWWLAAGALAGSLVGAAGSLVGVAGSLVGAAGSLGVAGSLGGAAGWPGQALAGVGSAAAVSGRYWAAIFFLRILFFLIFLFPLFSFRMVGAGDVKLLALTGGYLGISDGLPVCFCGFLAAAVWSLLHMLRKKIFLLRIKYFLSYVQRFLSTGQMVPYYDKERDGREVTVCLAPFIWCGFLIWLAVQRGGIR